MPALARDYTVIAVDQRGIGLTEKTQGGYDAATLASDLAALMTELGHERFAVVGHDTGYIIGYALAADHRDRVDRSLPRSRDLQEWETPRMRRPCSCPSSSTPSSGTFRSTGSTTN
jgi:hypothetical protein